MPLSEVLSGKPHPLSIALKDFSTDWRRITVHSPAAASGNVSVNVSGNSSSATSQNNITGALTGTRTYLTKGLTVGVEGRTYLIAYHLPGAGLDISALVQAAVTKNPALAAALTPESALPLSLLDLASLGALDDVRAFDMATELAEGEKAARVLGELFKGQDKPSAPSPPKDAK
jgi:hypothetical protein